MVVSGAVPGEAGGDAKRGGALCILACGLVATGSRASRSRPPYPTSRLRIGRFVAGLDQNEQYFGGGERGYAGKGGGEHGG
jgi:hypothetical protein